MPPKHPLLFSALALVLAILLLNASIIQVSGDFGLGAVIAVGIITLAAGIGIGYFLGKQHREPGVTLDSWLTNVVQGYETGITNFINYVDNLAKAMSYSYLYYARIAEYQAKNYVHVPPEEIDKYQGLFMLEVARDLWNFTKALADGLKNFVYEMKSFDQNLLTGEAASYVVVFTGSPDCPQGSQISCKITDAYYYVPVWSFTKNVNITAYFFDGISIITDEYGGTLYIKDLRYGTIYQRNLSPNSEYREPFSPGLYNIYISYGATAYPAKYGIRMDSGWVISGQYEAALAVRYSGWVIVNDMAIRNTNNIYYSKHIAFEKALEKVTQINYDLVAIHNNAWLAGKAQYLAYRSAGYTDPSQIPPDAVLPPIDIILPTLKNLFNNFSKKAEDVLAYYLAAMQSISKTLNETNYKMVKVLDAMNLTFADVREKLLNVVIRNANGTIWAVVQEMIPLWVSKAQEIVANQSNVLQGVIGALVKFANGTIKYVEIPAGWSITPAGIITPSGPQPSVVWQNYSAGWNPAYQPGNQTTPEFQKGLDDMMEAALNLFIIMMPLILIIAVVRMISDLGGRR